MGFLERLYGLLAFLPAAGLGLGLSVRVQNLWIACRRLGLGRGGYLDFPRQRVGLGRAGDDLEVPSGGASRGRRLGCHSTDTERQANLNNRWLCGGQTRATL